MRSPKLVISKPVLVANLQEMSAEALQNQADIMKLKLESMTPTTTRRGDFSSTFLKSKEQELEYKNLQNAADMTMKI